MRVAVDATPLLGRPTGVGVSVRGLLQAMAMEDAAGNDFEVVGYGLTGRGWRRLQSLVPSGHVVRVPMPAAVFQRLWRVADHPSIEWWTGRIDVVHGTNFVVPPARRAARLVTVHDLTAVRFPELCSPAALRYPALVRRALAGGADVHTPARAMAAEICEHFGVAEDRVHVIGWGVDVPEAVPARPAAAEAGPAAAEAVPAAAEAVPTGPAGPAATRPGPPYVLGLGTVEPRKDFPLLVAAFDRIAGGHPELVLRIVGPRGWGAEALDAAVAASPYRARIRRDGWVDDLGAVIAGATVFAYPSVYEGFGLPPLEAMAYGVPVVATAAGAVPEVVGDAADLVPVGDADALAAALARVLDDGAHRARLIAAGTARLAHFTWERSARAMLDLYGRLSSR